MDYPILSSQLTRHITAASYLIQVLPFYIVLLQLFHYGETDLEFQYLWQMLYLSKEKQCQPIGTLNNFRKNTILDLSGKNRDNQFFF